ncbi:MAG TPA: CidA/LrgA family protein [Burkholderiaceae bacterium]|nr:CidA/LrgA family protein [Burkholderiaceae bacterium]
MIGALATLLGFQLAGEVIAFGLHLPIPGPVLGMAMLLGYLAVDAGAAARLRDTSAGVLKHLSLLFVPAGVGIMQHAGRIGAEWLPITVALAASSVLSIAATAATIAWFKRRLDAQDADAAQ